MAKLWVIWLALILPACGMQGDLYLPEEPSVGATDSATRTTISAANDRATSNVPR